MPAPLVGAAAVAAARLLAKQFVKSGGKKVLSKAGATARKRTIKNAAKTTTGKVKAAQKLNRLNASGKGLPITKAANAVKRSPDGKRVGKVKVVIEATNPTGIKGPLEIIRASGRNRDISKGKTKYIQNDGTVFPRTRTQKSNVRRETTGRK
jgi:hypothetical protein